MILYIGNIILLFVLKAIKHWYNMGGLTLSTQEFFLQQVLDIVVDFGYWDFHFIVAFKKMEF